MTSPIAVYFLPSAGVDTSALVTPSFSPADGELITVCSTTWDTNNPAGAVSGGGQAWSQKNIASPGGFAGYARVDGCIVSGTPGPMQVTVAGTASPSRHCACVIRWPVGMAFGSLVSAPKSGSGLPSANLTTTGLNSIILWCSVDVASQDPAAAAYKATDGTTNYGVTVAGLGDFHAGSNSVQYFPYAQVGAIGAYSVGMTAPGSQAWVLPAIELLDVVVPPSTSGLVDTDISQGADLWRIRQSGQQLRETGTDGASKWTIAAR